MTFMTYDFSLLRGYPLIMTSSQIGGSTFLWRQWSARGKGGISLAWRQPIYGVSSTHAIHPPVCLPHPPTGGRWRRVFSNLYWRPFWNYLPPTGDYLKNFTSELKPKNHIVELLPPVPRITGTKPKTGTWSVRYVVSPSTFSKATSSTKSPSLSTNCESSRYTIPTKSKVTLTPKTLEMVQETKRSSANASSIQTPSTRTPTDTPPNAKMRTWRTLT